MKLGVQYIEKPWGRTELPPIFDPAPGRRIGELRFSADGDFPLIAKCLFTSENLSVEVDPDDEQARRRGLTRGKAECWYVLDAEPDTACTGECLLLEPGDELEAEGAHLFIGAAC